MKTASARAFITHKMRKFTFLEAFGESKIEDLLTILRDPCSQLVVTLPLRSNKKSSCTKFVQLLFRRKFPTVLEVGTEASDGRPERVPATKIQSLPHSTEASSVKDERDQFPKEISWRGTHVVQAFGLCIYLSEF